MIFLRDAVTTIKHVTDAKVAVYSCPFDIQTTETKGTVLITNADELLNFSKSEEESMEKLVKPLAESGVNVVVSGGELHPLLSNPTLSLTPTKTFGFGQLVIFDVRF